MTKNFFSRYQMICICVSMSMLFFSVIISGCASMSPQPTVVNCQTVDASALQGILKGTWKGIALNTAEVYGEFEITVLPDGKITGTYTGSASGDITGCIDPKGNLRASGISSKGKITWIGNIYKSNGKLAGNGTWDFGSGNGTWSGQR